MKMKSTYLLFKQVISILLLAVLLNALPNKDDICLGGESVESETSSSLRCRILVNKNDDNDSDQFLPSTSGSRQLEVKLTFSENENTKSLDGAFKSFSNLATNKIYTDDLAFMIGPHVKEAAVVVAKSILPIMDSFDTRRIVEKVLYKAGKIKRMNPNLPFVYEGLISYEFFDHVYNPTLSALNKFTKNIDKENIKFHWADLGLPCLHYFLINLADIYQPPTLHYILKAKPNLKHSIKLFAIFGMKFLTDDDNNNNNIRKKMEDLYNFSQSVIGKHVLKDALSNIENQVNTEILTFEFPAIEITVYLARTFHTILKSKIAIAIIKTIAERAKHNSLDFHRGYHVSLIRQGYKYMLKQSRKLKHFDAVKKLWSQNPSQIDTTNNESSAHPFGFSESSSSSETFTSSSSSSTSNGIITNIIKLAAIVHSDLDDAENFYHLVDFINSEAGRHAFNQHDIIMALVCSDSKFSSTAIQLAHIILNELLIIVASETTRNTIGNYLRAYGRLVDIIEDKEIPPSNNIGQDGIIYNHLPSRSNSFSSDHHSLMASPIESQGDDFHYRPFGISSPVSSSLGSGINDDDYLP